MKKSVALWSQKFRSPALPAQGVDQDANHVLDVGDLHHPLADLEQGIPPHCVGVGRREVEDMAERLPMIGGDVPELALTVVDEHARRPGDEGGHDVASPLPAPRRADDDGVLHPVIGQVAAAETPENAPGHAALRIDQFRALHVLDPRPGGGPKRARRTAGPAHHHDGGGERHQTDSEAHEAREVKGVWIGPIIAPVPVQEGPGRVDSQASDVGQPAPELARIVEGGGDVLGGGREARQEREEREKA